MSPSDISLRVFSIVVVLSGYLAWCGGAFGCPLENHREIPCHAFATSRRRTEAGTSVTLLCLATSEPCGTSSAKIPTRCMRETNSNLVAASEVSLSSELWLKAFTGHSLRWLKVEVFATFCNSVESPNISSFCHWWSPTQHASPLKKLHRSSC